MQPIYLVLDRFGGGNDNEEDAVIPRFDLRKCPLTASKKDTIVVAGPSTDELFRWRIAAVASSRISSFLRTFRRAFFSCIFVIFLGTIVLVDDVLLDLLLPLLGPDFAPGTLMVDGMALNVASTRAITRSFSAPLASDNRNGIVATSLAVNESIVRA